jgi:hypothetical protein
MMEGAKRWSIRERPPERFHAFISYTTRDDEVNDIKRIVDKFLDGYLRPQMEAALGEPPVFYDGWYLRNIPDVIRSDFILRKSLHFAIEESEMLLAFVSPSYVGSDWTRAEIEMMVSKKPRAWYDICREAPCEELRDRRRNDMRPSRWERLLAALARRRYERTDDVESPIILIVWKGKYDVPGRLRLSPRCQVFDWRACGRYFEWTARIAEHYWKHGSVSSHWEDNAATEGQACEAGMSDTAKAIVGALLARREAYRQSARRWGP